MAEETRLVDGKLTDMGREPRNVQVVVGVDDEGWEIVSLRDVTGVFTEACRVFRGTEKSGVSADGADDPYISETERGE